MCIKSCANDKSDGMRDAEPEVVAKDRLNG